MLFSERSIWTMVHGIGLGGGALIGLAAAFCSTSMPHAQMAVVCAAERGASVPALCWSSAGWGLRSATSEGARLEARFRVSTQSLR